MYSINNDMFSEKCMKRTYYISKHPFFIFLKKNDVFFVYETYSNSEYEV